MNRNEWWSLPKRERMRLMREGKERKKRMREQEAQRDKEDAASELAAALERNEMIGQLQRSFHRALRAMVRGPIRQQQEVQMTELLTMLHQHERMNQDRPRIIRRGTRGEEE